MEYYSYSRLNSSCRSIQLPNSWDAGTEGLPAEAGGPCCKQEGPSLQAELQGNGFQRSPA
jgi:hypothetical protein